MGSDIYLREEGRSGGHGRSFSVFCVFQSFSAEVFRTPKIIENGSIIKILQKKMYPTFMVKLGTMDIDGLLSSKERDVQHVLFAAGAHFHHESWIHFLL